MKKELLKQSKKLTNGITLVALVVTIVVLLILAGITIVYVFGDNGVFGQAKNAKDQTTDSKFEERLSMANTEAFMKRAAEGGLTPEEYFEILKKHNIISDTTVPGGNISSAIENGDGSKTYEITSDDDYIFEATIYPDGRIETEIIGKDGNIEPKVRSIIVTGKTKTEIDIKVSARLQGGTVKAYYKKASEGASVETENSVDGYTEVTLDSNLTGKISDLTAGEEYKIKAIIEKDGKVVSSKSINTTTGIAVSSIALNKTETTLDVGKELKLEATVLPENAENKEIEWTSSDSTVATVDQTGKVTGIKASTTPITITATSKDINTIKATCKVTVELAESNWKKIAKIAKEIAEGRTTEAVDRNSIQATVTVDGKQEAIEVGQEFYVKHNNILRKVRVLGFKHDTLTNPTSAYGSGTIATKAGISFEFVEFMIDTGKPMNSTNDNTNGWAATEMRTWLEGSEGIGKISEACRTNIKQVNKPYIKTYNDASSVTNSPDKLWLLSCSEMWSKGRSDNNAPYGLAIEKEGEQYKWYMDNEKGIDPKDENDNFTKKANR